MAGYVMRYRALQKAKLFSCPLTREKPKSKTHDEGSNFLYE
jgi:hypothetical protein